MIVLMINREPRPFQHWPDPADAVIAVIRMLRQPVSNQESLRRAVMDVQPENFPGCAAFVTCSFLRQRMSPIFFHSFNPLLQDQLTGMTLRVLVNRLVPI